MSKAKKTRYYRDELNDDFAPTRDKINVQKLNDDYRYIRSKPAQAIGQLLHKLIAAPIIFLYTKLVYGLKINNRRALKNIKGACFLYGNHTSSVLDAFVPTIISFPKTAKIIVADDAVSIPIIKHLVPHLGALPLPSSVKGTKNFVWALEKISRTNSTVTVYPEAHLWPYYNGIRNFKDGSFSYPVKNNVPVLGFVITYRQRRIFKSLPPLASVTLSEPFYPDESLSLSENKKMLRDKVYNFMRRTVKEQNSYEYIAYRKAE